MKLKNIQLDLLKALLSNPKSVAYQDAGDKVVFVTGPAAYAIPKKDVCLSTEKLNSTSISVLDKVQRTADTELTATADYKLEGKVRKFAHDDGAATYIDTKLLKHFENYRLYQARNNPMSLVIVEEVNEMTGELEPVGAVMPFRVKE